ncbi:MAG: nuclear transport factor 2 family protein [Candidatus Dormibacteraceae bacterium]
MSPTKATTIGRARAGRTIQNRLDRLESEREIQALVHRYAELCDAAYDPDGLAALFTVDATWSSRTRDGSVDFGRYEGREAIRAFFAGASRDLGPMTLHYLLTPRVELAEDGVSATGVCYLLAILDQRPASSQPGSADRERVLLGGVYSHRFRRVDGRWLISGSACDLSLEEPLRSATSPKL